jgi:hypothetical protein
MVPHFVKNAQNKRATMTIPTAEALQHNLLRQLFQNPALQAYAILDGASNPALLEQLNNDQPEFSCLYRGELEPDIAECAPYLVKLDAGAPFTHWISSGLGNHWGIFAVADCDLRTLRRHLRTLNMVYDPETHKPLLFRYYDPRVLSVFLPTCDREQMTAFFGPVQAYFAETEGGGDLASFYRSESQVTQNNS